MTTEPETKRAKTSDDVDAMETDDKENVAMEVETKGKGGIRAEPSCGEK